MMPLCAPTQHHHCCAQPHVKQPADVFWLSLHARRGWSGLLCGGCGAWIAH